MVTTNDWSTGFFLFDIGLFQGFVLINCVFQLLLTPTVSTFRKPYADDLTLRTQNAQNTQHAVDMVNTWLMWTQAKPSKNVSLVLKLIKKNNRNELFAPVCVTLYSPFYPRITINGQQIKFILNPAEKDSFEAKYFKFLGR